MDITNRPADVEFNLRDGNGTLVFISFASKLVEMFQAVKIKAVILMITICLCGCRTSEDLPHPEGISDVNLNHAIKIIAPQAWNTFKLGDIVSLQIVNLSNQTLVFDKNFGGRVFLIEDNQWIEVENKLKSIGSEIVTLESTINDQNDTRGFSVKLDLSGKTSRTEIRIYVFGKFSETEEVVGAFINVLLKP